MDHPISDRNTGSTASIIGKHFIPTILLEEMHKE